MNFRLKLFSVCLSTSASNSRTKAV